MFTRLCSVLKYIGISTSTTNNLLFNGRINFYFRHHLY